MSKQIKQAVILLSGGLDSTVVLSHCNRLGFDIHAMAFDYGQRHKSELKCAQWQASYFKCKSFKIFKIDMYGGSSLTDNINVPNHSNVNKIPNIIPNTYVPSRNIIFLSFASGYAEYLNINNIFIGVNSVDYSGYPDCRIEFIKQFEALLNFSTKQGLEKKFKIETPLIKMTKKEIVLLGYKNGVNFLKTSSCYDPKDGQICKKCDSCLLRKKGFDEANIIDPKWEV